MFKDEHVPATLRRTLVAALFAAAMIAAPLAAQQSPPRPTDALRIAYEQSQKARTDAQFTLVIDLCNRALSGEPSERNKAYAQQLMAWALKKRGLVRAEAKQPLAAIGDFTKLVQLTEKELSDSPDVTSRTAGEKQLAWVYNKRGELYASQQQDQEALADFERAVGYDSQSWQAAHNRGVSYAMLGKVPEASADFDRVIELKPDYAAAWFNRGELRQQEGDLGRAIEDYDQAIKLKPNDRAAYVSRGQAHYGQENYDAALNDYAQAIRIDPKYGAAYIHRGTTLMETGRYAEAARDFKLAIRVDVQNPAAYQAAAWLMATCPDPQFRDNPLAIQAAQKAIELNTSRDVRYLETLAAAYASAGQFDKAVANQRKAIAQAAPDESGIGQMQQRLGLYQRNQAYRYGGRTASSAIAPRQLRQQR